MKNNYCKLTLIILIFISIISCENTENTDSTNSDESCQLTKIETNDGSSISYKYNSRKQWENITITEDSKSTTFNLAFDLNSPNGPVVNIGKPGNNYSLTVLDYDKNDFLQIVTTNIKEMDMGTILGKAAIGKNFETKLTFKWNSDNQVIKRDYVTTVDIVTEKGSEPFSFSGYETFEYDNSKKLVKKNIFSSEKIIVLGKEVVSLEQLGYTILEYDSKSTKFAQSLGLKNLSLQVFSDGQVLIEPVTSNFPIVKSTYYAIDGNGGTNSYTTEFTHTNNASGYLSKTVSDGDIYTYSYSNCK